VVACIRHGRPVDRRYPHGISTQGTDVVQLGCDAGQVPHAVVVGVGEGPRIDLVDDGLLPPPSNILRHRELPLAITPVRATSSSAPTTLSVPTSGCICTSPP